MCYQTGARSLQALDPYLFSLAARPETDMAEPVSIQRPNVEHELLFELLKHFPNGSVNVFDADLRYLFAAGTGLEAVGLEATALVGRTVYDLYPKEAVALVEGPYRRALAGESVAFELPFADRVYEVSCRPLPAFEGRAPALLAVAHDITQRKQAETGRELRLLESERTTVQAHELRAAAQAAERYSRALFNATGDAILVADENGRYLDANSAAEQLLGYTADELRRLGVADVVGAGADWGEEEYARFVAEGAWRGELELRRKDGEMVPVEALATLMESPGGAVGVSVLRDISERRRLESLQQELLAGVSHELRNPLTPIIGLAQFMLKTQQFDRESVQDIVDYGQRLQRMIDDLLDASRIAAQQFELVRADVDIAAALRDLVARWQRIAPQRRFEFCRTAGDGVVGLWDRERLMQIFDNLISNAVKYSTPESPVVVTLDARERDVEISVRDEGIGMSRRSLHRVFDRFYRSSEAKRKSKGVGLGLYIVKALVEAHGGAIHAESEGPGRGSTFRVVLPRKAA